MSGRAARDLQAQVLLSNSGFEKLVVTKARPRQSGGQVRVIAITAAKADFLVVAHGGATDVRVVVRGVVIVGLVKFIKVILIVVRLGIVPVDQGLAVDVVGYENRLTPDVAVAVTAVAATGKQNFGMLRFGRQLQEFR